MAADPGSGLPGPWALGPHGSSQSLRGQRSDLGWASLGLLTPQSSLQVSQTGPARGPPTHGSPVPNRGGGCAQGVGALRGGRNTQPSQSVCTTSPGTPATLSSIHKGPLRRGGAGGAATRTRRTHLECSQPPCEGAPCCPPFIRGSERVRALPEVTQLISSTARNTTSVCSAVTPLLPGRALQGSQPLPYVHVNQRAEETGSGQPGPDTSPGGKLLPPCTPALSGKLRRPAHGSCDAGPFPL